MKEECKYEKHYDNIFNYGECLKCGKNKIMETTKTINGKEVVFEAVEMVDNHGYSREWSMMGYTKEGETWKHTHNATGSFTYTDDLEELTDIEEV